MPPDVVLGTPSLRLVTSPETAETAQEAGRTAQAPCPTDHVVRLTAQQEVILRCRQEAASVRSCDETQGVECSMVLRKSCGTTSSPNLSRVLESHKCSRSTSTSTSTSRRQFGSTSPDPRSCELSSECASLAPITNDSLTAKCRQVSAPPASSAASTYGASTHSLQTRRLATFSPPVGGISDTTSVSQHDQTARQRSSSQAARRKTHRLATISLPAGTAGLPAGSTSQTPRRDADTWELQSAASAESPAVQTLTWGSECRSGSCAPSLQRSEPTATPRLAFYLKCNPGLCAASLQQSELLCRPRPILKSVSMDALSRLSPAGTVPS